MKIWYIVVGVKSSASVLKNINVLEVERSVFGSHHEDNILVLEDFDHEGACYLVLGKSSLQSWIYT